MSYYDRDRRETFARDDKGFNDRDYNDRNRYDDRRRDDGRNEGFRGYQEPRSDYPDKFGGKTFNEKKELLQRLSSYLYKARQYDLHQILHGSVVGGIKAVELYDFIYFLQGRELNFKEDDAYFLASKYAMERGYGSRHQQFVDISRLEQDMELLDHDDKDNFVKQTRGRKNGYDVLEQVFKEVADYIYNSGGSIFKIFQIMDVDQSNYLNPDELRTGLTKIGCKSLSNQDFDALYDVLDDNGDGKISYNEFSNRLAAFSNTKSIDDQYHWAYPIFTQVRRKVKQMDKSIKMIFSKNGDQKIPAKDFIKILETLPCQFKRHQEQELLELLDAPANQNMVDLMLFSELVGIEKDSNCKHKEILERIQKEPEPKCGHQKNREAIRHVVDLLRDRNVNIGKLRMELNVAAGRKSSFIPIKDFVSILEYECDPQRKADIKMLQTVADYYCDPKNNDVDYEKFLNAIDSALEMGKVISYMFGQFDMLLDGKKMDLTELFTKHLPRRASESPILKIDEVKSAFMSMHIELHHDEIGALIAEYDTTGRARDLYLKELQKDFESWKDGLEKKLRVGGREKFYDDFRSKYGGDRETGGGKRQPKIQIESPRGGRGGRDTSNPRRQKLSKDMQNVLDRHHRILKDIVKGIEDRHSGPQKWFANASRDGKTLDQSEFVKAISDLRLKEEYSWKISSKELFYELTQYATLDLFDLNDLLKEVQTEEVYKESHEEQMLGELVNHFDADDEILQTKFEQCQKRDRYGIVSVRDFAMAIAEERPKPSTFEIEDVIQHYGTGSRKDEVDIRRFKDEFNRLAKQRGIRPGRYKSKPQPDIRRPTIIGSPPNEGGGFGFGRNSPRGGPPYGGHMPGQSPTQTRINVGKYGSQKERPPRDYMMPRNADPKKFEEIMIACYLIDVLVEDHFKKYARSVKDRRGDVVHDSLRDNEFEEGIKQLGLDWRQRDVQQVLGWIDEAFNDRRADGTITAMQIDEAVHYETTKTVDECQLDVLKQFQNLSLREKSDFKAKLVRAEQRTRNQRLNLNEVDRIIQEELQSIRLQKIEVSLFLKKYEQNGDIIVQRLTDDIMMGKEAPGGSGGGFVDSGRKGTGFGPDNVTPDDGRLKDLHMMLSPYQEELSRGFSRHEGNSAGFIRVAEFIAEISKVEKLSIRDEDLLVAEYEERGTREINYRMLLEDLRKIRTNPILKKATFTKDQEEVIENCKKWLSKHEDQLIRMVASMKQADKVKKGYLKESDIHQIFRKNRLEIGSTQMGHLANSVSKNQRGDQLSYKELLILLCGEKKGEDLFTADIQQLTDGTWNKAAQISKKFVMPTETMNAHSGPMDSIGRQIIRTRENYEEVFVNAASPMANKKDPEMSLTDINHGLKKLGLNLNTSETSDLRAFVKENSNRDGMILLSNLLKALGLPPQTVGAAKTQKGHQKLLSNKELEECHKVLMSVKTEFERNKNNVITRLQSKTRGDVLMRPNDLLNFVIQELGDRVAQSLGIQKFLPLLVAYLADEDPKQISVKKLELEFSNRLSDAPLQQSNVEELKEYMAKLTEDAVIASGVSKDVTHLVQFMNNNNLKLIDFFKSPNEKEITVQKFRDLLDKHRYQPKHFDQLADDLMGQNGISSEKLKKALNHKALKGPKSSGTQIKDRINRLPPDVRKYLDKIEKYLTAQGMTIKQLHSKLDIDKDGNVTKMEFVTRMREIDITGIVAKDLGLIFDAIDVNGDGSLSVGEFSLYLEGSKKNKSERLKQMDPLVLDQMKSDINVLFDMFDEDGNGSVDANEIFRTLQTFGIRKDIQECKDMITRAGGVDGLNRKQFLDVMLPMMQEEILSKDDEFMDLRTKFLEADTDYSGFLTIDELYECLVSMGANLEPDEVAALMAEIDLDRNAKLDIDEFLSLMSLGEDANFQNKGVQDTYKKIHKARRLNPVDFLKCFMGMPTNFVPSLIEERWTKHRKNLPSSVFKAQIDPTTMLWKDCLEVRTEEIKEQNVKKGFIPKARPIETFIGCQIVLDEAQGVTLPKQGKESEDGFKDSDIVKRSIRIAIEQVEGKNREIVHNAIQVPAIWNKADEDIWKFDRAGEKALSTIMFRTTKNDKLEGESRLIFELVVSVKKEKKVIEMSCGWCEIPIQELSKKMDHKLEIKGGSPGSQVDIKDSDVRNNRSGFKFLAKVVQTGVPKRLEIQVTPIARLKADVVDHLELMPSTCLFHRPLLFFLSGYINYRNDKLIKETANSSQFLKPSGDVVLSCFPKIYDNPDIVEELSKIWVEDIVPLIEKRSLDIDYIISFAKDYISRLYSVLYSEEFKSIEFSGTTKSAIGENEKLIEKRRKLINTALRYKQEYTKSKVSEPLHELTTFKPFSIRELEFNVWETSKSNQTKYMQRFEDKGIIGGFAAEPVVNETAYNNNMYDSGKKVRFN